MKAGYKHTPSTIAKMRAAALERQARRRDPAEAAHIRAAKQRKAEEDILRQADEIRARRAS